MSDEYLKETTIERRALQAPRRLIRYSGQDPGSASDGRGDPGRIVENGGEEPRGTLRKRGRDRMHDRFTERVRKVMYLAREEAGRLLGLGRLTVDAVLGRDYPTIQAALDAVEEGFDEDPEVVKALEAVKRRAVSSVNQPSVLPSIEILLSS